MTLARGATQHHFIERLRLRVRLAFVHAAPHVRVKRQASGCEPESALAAMSAAVTSSRRKVGSRRGCFRAAGKRRCGDWSAWCSYRVRDINAAISRLRSVEQQLGGLPELRICVFVLGKSRIDATTLTETHGLCIEHWTALCRGKTIARQIDHIDVACAQRNTFVEDSRAFVDQRIHAALHDFFVGDRARRHADFISIIAPSGRSLRDRTAAFGPPPRSDTSPCRSSVQAGRARQRDRRHGCRSTCGFST